jgi:hypothetical protein
LEEVNAAIAKHAETLAKIKTLHVKVELVDLSPELPKSQRTQISESWKSGLRERVLIRNYVTLTTKGAKVSEKAGGDVRIGVYDATSVRGLVGWDPEDPLPTPLDFTKSVSVLDRVNCSISPRDPSEMTSDDWQRLLLEVWRARPLREVVKTAEVVPLEAPNPDTVRFQLKSTENDSLMGGIFELDKKHGYLVRKREFSDGGVKEVDEFAEFADGVWLPKRIHLTMGGGKLVYDTTLLDAHVNENISG